MANSKGFGLFNIHQVSVGTAIELFVGKLV
jgi:hypothetical protein